MESAISTPLIVLIPKKRNDPLRYTRDYDLFKASWRIAAFELAKEAKIERALRS